MLLDVLNKIRKVRLEKNFSQENMAFELGISQGYYAKIEKGIAPLSLSNFLKISNVLNVYPNVFFENTNVNQNIINLIQENKKEILTLKSVISNQKS